MLPMKEESGDLQRKDRPGDGEECSIDLVAAFGGLYILSECQERNIAANNTVVAEGRGHLREGLQSQNRQRMISRMWVQFVPTLRCRDGLLFGHEGVYKKASSYASFSVKGTSKGPAKGCSPSAARTYAECLASTDRMDAISVAKEVS